MRRMDFQFLEKAARPVFWGALVIGLILRFCQITRSDFIFYDEGYYLNFNLRILYFIQTHFPQQWSDLCQAIWLCLRYSLATGKALWFFIVDSRVFFGLTEAWFVPRVVAALSGALTLGMVYIFAKRWSNSNLTAVLSLIFLSILPSHVFYSRIAIQETLSAFFFLSGFYFYLFPQQFGRRTIFSAVLLAAAYFSNYRLIIIPVLVWVAEAASKIEDGKRPDVRKFIWHSVIFSVLVVLIGVLDQAQNMYVTFSWMFHQAQLGGERFDWFNFFSYPYYIFRLEHWIFGTLFFANLYFLGKRNYRVLLPFALVLAQMLIFSVTADKAARYLGVVTPFMAVSVAAAVNFLGRELKIKFGRVIFTVAVLWMCAGMLIKSAVLAGFRSDYRPAMEWILNQNKEAKVLSTQSWVQNLYAPRRDQVKECPRQFSLFLKYFTNGFNYLIIDPQAYVSYTADGRKFSPPLKDYLGFIVTAVPPIKVFAHFPPIILERFVFEHNENFRQSLKFLREQGRGAGGLSVYNMEQCLAVIRGRFKHNP